MPAKIQRIVLRQFYDRSIHCPFCGSKVVLGSEEGHEAGSIIGSPCEHTLFIGHDIDLEYRSPAFDQNIGLDSGADLNGENIDEITDQVTLPDAIKVVGVPRPHAGGNSYVGFAVTSDR